MTDEPDKKVPLQARYAQQYADDLAANRTEQGRITEQIAHLEERLQQLVLEEAWLIQAQSNLPGAPASNGASAEPASGVATAPSADEAAPAGAADTAPRAVPAPRHDESVNEEQPEQAVRKAVAATTRVKKPAAAKDGKKPAAAKDGKRAAAKKPTAGKKTAAKKPEAGKGVAPKPVAGAADGKKPGVPLWQFVLDILLRTPGEPLVAREVADQLAKDHPSRATSIQVVRNNLEVLVRKDLAEKSLQKGSAMYTAYADTAATADTAADRAAEQPSGSAAEKALSAV